MKQLNMIMTVLALLLLTACASNPFLTQAPNGALQDDTSVAVTLLRAKEMEKAGDWISAAALYKNAMHRNSKDASLVKANKAFQKRWSRHLLKLEVEVLISQAEWAKKQHNYRRISELSYDNAGKRKLAKIAQALSDRGLKAMKLGRIRLASRAIHKALKISKNEFTTAAHKEYHKQLKLAKKARKSKKRRRRR